MTDSDSDCNYDSDSGSDSGLDFMDAHSRHVWSYVSDWDSLIDANIMFLNGEVHCSPDHNGPINDETVPMVAKLVELNEFGMFTNESQPPLDTETKKQRGYITGFVGHEIVGNLILFLQSRDDCYFQLDDGDMLHNFPCTRDCAFNVTCDDGNLYTNFWIQSDFRLSALSVYKGNIEDILSGSCAFELAMKDYGGTVGAEDVMLDFFRNMC